MKNVILSCVVASLAIPGLGFAQDFQSGQMPPQARAGQCYGRVLVPATYRNEAMSVVTREAFEQVQVSDPVFRAEQQSVTTSDPYKRYEVTEPTFRTEGQTIVTRPAHERLVAAPAVLSTRTETIVVREPRLVWRAGSNLSAVRRMDSATGEIFCLVEEAAVTQNITRVVQTTPGRVMRQAVPAQTQTIQRRVLVAPATVREIDVPGTYQNVTIETLVSPASERRSLAPEQRGTVNRQVIETAERYEWVPVVCENTPSGTVSVTAAQRALAAKGLYRGPIDGIVGSRTTQALREFQRQNRLPGNGSLTLETARRLGL
jgi:Putative peptidoglycan binding domain